MTTIIQAFPQGSAPFVNPSTGTINLAWMQLLISLWNRTGGANGSIAIPAIAPIAVASSPFSYTAVANGNIFIAPGTYCKVTITRNSVTLVYGYVTRGIFPVSIGDIITITYTTLTPVINFF